MGLGKDARLGRHIERSGTIVTTPILSGLHHRYARILFSGRTAVSVRSYCLDLLSLPFFRRCISAKLSRLGNDALGLKRSDPSSRRGWSVFSSNCHWSSP